MVAKSSRSSSRDAILRVFAEMVAERGYAETSIADVANALNLSKGTIVHHFGGKERMLGELHVAYFARRFREVDTIRENLDDVVDRLVATIYVLLAAHRDDRAASLACLRELVRYFTGGDLNDYVREQRRRFTSMVVDLLEEGRDSGALRVHDSTLVALQIFGMCNYAWTWYVPDGPRSVEEITATFAEGILTGLATDPVGVPDMAERVTKAVDVVRRAPGRLPEGLPTTSPVDLRDASAAVPRR